MKKESRYTLKAVRNGSSFYCDIAFTIEAKAELKHHTLEKIYITKYGNHIGNYSLSSIFIGLNYALERINSRKFYEIKIVDFSISNVETNQMMIAYATSRAVLENFDNSETIFELQNIEKELFANKQNDFNSLLIFKNRSELPRKVLFNEIAGNNLEDFILTAIGGQVYGCFSI